MVRNPADIGQASAALGVPGRALAVVVFFLGQDSFHYRGPAMQPRIFFYIGCRVIEAKTDQLFHGGSRPFLVKVFTRALFSGKLTSAFLSGPSPFSLPAQNLLF
jgi:hypothetical protein